jgi:pimeloyl-ACP methyl ester carboxylesterase
MSSITTADGTQIYYKDWGTGPPIVFSHGWPLTADAWEDQMFYLTSHGYRCIAHDRRGHGRSSQPWAGNDLDTYADDLAALTAHLDLNKAIHVGHSTGGGEVARYIGRHGTQRVAAAVLVSAIPPLMLKTSANPAGLPIEVFDQLRAGVLADRGQFIEDLSAPFYGANRPGSVVSKGLRDFFVYAVDVGRNAGKLFLHQGIFGNRFDRRPQEIRRPDADRTRRRRSDRTDRRIGAPVVEDRQTCAAQDLCGCAARIAVDAQGSAECGPARVREVRPSGCRRFSGRIRVGDAVLSRSR